MNVGKRDRSAVTMSAPRPLLSIPHMEIVAGTRGFTTRQLSEGAHGDVFLSEGIMAPGALHAVKRAKQHDADAAGAACHEIKKLARLHHANMESLANAQNAPRAARPKRRVAPAPGTVVLTPRGGIPEESFQSSSNTPTPFLQHSSACGSIFGHFCV